MPRATQSFLLRGGLDFVTSPLSISPGRLWMALNYVPVEAGYRRILGYERKDGRPSPSEASYWILSYTLGPGESSASADDEITGGTSGATAVVLKVLENDDAGGGDYVLGEVDGTFEDDEELQIGGTAKGSADGTPRGTAAPNVSLDLDYRDLAAAHRRNSIEAVPGTGAILGVWYYGGALYAVRDNPGGTAGILHKATSSGWSEVDLGSRISFDAGSSEPETGEEIEGATSGATATLGHVVVASGAWADGDAEGVMWLHDVTGAFQDNENLDQGGTVRAIADGAATVNALPSGGRYEFINHNFYGQAATRRMYGVSGEGKAFSFDGTQFVELSTGQPTDNPKHISAHRNRLALAYEGGSLVISEAGNPDGYAGVSGAAEIACGQNILGLIQVGAGNTMVMGDDRMQVLYGNDSSDFQLADHSEAQTGGVEWTLQSVGAPLYMDNRGVRRFDTTDAYGNFVINTMTRDVQPWLDTQRDEKNVPISSMRVRQLDQYRVFFGNNFGLVVYLGRGRPELAIIDYGVPVRCTVSAEDSDRIERVYFGSDDGWVFEAERGRSFDGNKISYHARLPLNHVGLPASSKKFFKADLHIDVKSQVRMYVAANFNDGEADSFATPETIYGGGGIWNEAFWDEFYWDSPLNGYAELPLDGQGRNCSILIRGATSTEETHTINGLTIHYSVRRMVR